MKVFLVVGDTLAQVQTNFSVFVCTPFFPMVDRAIRGKLPTLWSSKNLGRSLSDQSLRSPALALR